MVHISGSFRLSENSVSATSVREKGSVYQEDKAKGVIQSIVPETQ